MVNIKLSGLLDEGRIVQEQLIKILQRHEDALGDSSSADTSQGNRITALETAIGSATGDNPSGLAKDVSDIQTAIGSATGDNPSGLAKDVSDIQTVIGSATGDNPSGLAHDVDDLADYIAEILSANDSLTDPRAETQGDG